MFGKAPICRSYFIGDSCLCWSLGGEIDRLTSLQILHVYHRLKKEPAMARLGVLDLVPSYNALALHAAPLSDWRAIRKVVDRFFRRLPGTERKLAGKNPVHRIPVRYTGEDLPRVAELHRLTVEEVVELHAAAEYMVAMIGFRPHFPYLLGLDPRLETPRLDTPRLRVPAGSVAIGGQQTGIYPAESPGGWNIIGFTDTSLLKSMAPGDIVTFFRIGP